MKKDQIVVVILFLSLFAACSPKTFTVLDWQVKEVVVDGKIPEWENPLRFYDDKSKINYTISNDRKNLYICLKLADETSQMKVLRNGLEFSIDTLGKKDFPVTFAYPVQPEPGKMQKRERKEFNTMSSGEMPNPNKMKKELLGQMKEVRLTGFKAPLAGFASLVNNTSGIQASMDFDNAGVLFYEAVIPFKTFYKDELTPADSNKVFCYRFKINGFSMPSGSRGNGQGGEGGPGGGHEGKGHGGQGGPGGGGPGGGGHGGKQKGMQSNNEMTAANQIIVKMRFSYK
jgi:hypothetical protein